MSDQKINFNEDQLDVINAPIGDMLVSAAAGSGKTTVLVARIVAGLEKGLFDIDEILVVTFTNDAADHMKNKIREAISDRIKELKSTGSSQDIGLAARLRTQSDKLPNAYIQTLNGFCNRVIREKGYILGTERSDVILEPNLAIMDENELKLLLSNSVKRALEEAYIEGSTEFIELTEMFGDGRTDDSLVDSIVEAYGKLRSIPDYLSFCDELVSRRIECDNDGELIGSAQVVDDLRLLFDKATPERFSELHQLVDTIAFVKKGNNKRQAAFHELIFRMENYFSSINRLYEDDATPDEIIRKIIDCDMIANDYSCDEGTIHNGLRYTNDNEGDTQRFEELFAPIACLSRMLWPSLGKGNAPNGYKDCAALISLPEGNEAYIKDLLSDKTLAEAMMKQCKRTRMTSAYVDALKKTDRIYRELKARLRGMDFADQEHIASAILSDDEAASFYRDRFKEIYIDEYQDNSRLQDHIIYKISREGRGNVFRVGDVKQSIYKFRNAEPAMFMEKLNEYNGDNDRLKLLNSNYRSSKSILRFVNDIFGQIMTRDGAEIEYDDTQKLGWDEKNAKEGTLPRVVVVDSRKDDLEEGEVLDDRICIKQGVLKEVSGYIARHSGDDPKDLLSGICILTRVNKTASVVASYLNENGIPAVYSDEYSVFDDPDIKGVCNIIIGLANQYRDEYILGILLSGYRISNFTVNDLSRIQIHGKKNGYADKNLMVRLRTFASSSVPEEDEDIRRRCDLFLEWFDSVRADMILTDIGELVNRIYCDTGICSKDQITATKLSMFKDWLCDGFMKYGSDIASVADRLEEMKIKLKSRSSVKADPDMEGKIRCMSYHASKGLEFSYVIVAVADEGGGQEKAGSVKFDPDSGFIVDDYDNENISRKDSCERKLYKDKERLSENAEIMRLLYVALTRAQDELSVVVPLELDGGDADFSNHDTSASFPEFVRKLLRNPQMKLGKAFWTNTTPGIVKDLMAALLRTAPAGELMSILKRIYIKPQEGGSISYEASEINSFELEIMRPVPEHEDKSNNTDNDEVSPEEIARIEDKEMIPLCCTEYDKETGKPVFAPYPFEDSTSIPFKISVSQIKSGTISETLPINLQINRYSYFKDRIEGKVGDTASQVGTFIHKLFRFIDLEAITKDDQGFERELEQLVAEGIVRKEEKPKALEFKEGIFAFASSDIGKMVIEADRKGLAEYEKPIVFAVPSGGNDFALVQGIIDLFVRTDGDNYVIDYKTDRMPDKMTREERAAEARNRHSVQVNFYSEACEASGTKVDRRYIYLVRYGEFVEISK